MHALIFSIVCYAFNKHFVCVYLSGGVNRQLYGRARWRWMQGLHGSAAVKLTTPSSTVDVK